MGNRSAFDQAKVAAFGGKALGDVSGIATIIMANLSDKSRRAA